MSPNTLTGTVGLMVGPIIMETLVKHYFERIRGSSSDSKDDESVGTITSNLRQDELLYDQAFNIIKTFMATAAKHTIEELQEFANTRTPSPPWVRVVRLMVPMSCCDEAAGYVIKALGGEDATRRVVGGTKWWQVRGLKGVSAEWITAKKDWKEAKQRHKAMQKQKGIQRSATLGYSTPDQSDEPGTYHPDMDEQRCILYFHGGGYYFGSVDQERYSIQRFARKINGRVFAINYRLSPQYPFPCAIQDAVAAYLYLIRPPPEALHRPVNPEHIIVMGDSAGGGLSLALLQVIRDAGLPQLAGGVLVSPWCDMSHSFPSVLKNTATDVIPYYGLALHKHSTLWPPPPDLITSKVHKTLKSRIREIVHLDTQGRLRPAVQEVTEARVSTDDLNLFTQGHVSSDTPPEHPGKPVQPLCGDSQILTMKTETGEVLTIDNQVQFYAPNNVLGHPWVSPVGGYLGGLPPLFFIASEKEVLRDEIIYTAHKAAHPHKYPLKDEVKKLYPVLQDIESKYGPTNVHLQVYDDCAHVLPVLFAFTTPAKFCFRAIAGFCRHVTGMIKVPHTPVSPATPTPILGGEITATPDEDVTASGELPSPNRSLKFAEDDVKSTKTQKSAKKVWTLNGTKTWPRFSRSPSNMSFEGRDTLDVGGPRFDGVKAQSGDPRCAGSDPFMYVEPFEQGNMIRERVSIRGIVRALEAEEELPAFQIAPEDVGAIPEHFMRRYIEGKEKYDKKFANTIKDIQKQREKNYHLAKKEGLKNLSHLQSYLMKAEEDGDKERNDEEKGISGSWNWAWALDDGERPPPSSIVSRRDTSEARDLAKIADLMSDANMSGNNLWTHLVTFFTVTPDKDGTKSEVTDADQKIEAKAATAPAHERGTSTRSRFWREKFRPKTTSKLRDRERSRNTSVSSLSLRSPESGQRSPQVEAEIAKQ